MYEITVELIHQDYAAYLPLAITCGHRPQNNLLQVKHYPNTHLPILNPLLSKDRNFNIILNETTNSDFRQLLHRLERPGSRKSLAIDTPKLRIQTGTTAFIKDRKLLKTVPKNYVSAAESGDLTIKVSPGNAQLTFKKVSDLLRMSVVSCYRITSQLYFPRYKGERLRLRVSVHYSITVGPFTRETLKYIQNFDRNALKTTLPIERKFSLYELSWKPVTNDYVQDILAYFNNECRTDSPFLGAISNYFRDHSDPWKSTLAMTQPHNSLFTAAQKGDLEPMAYKKPLSIFNKGLLSISK